MVKEVIPNLDSSKVSDPDYIRVVLRRSYQWSLYLRMLGKGLLLKTSALLVLFLWLVKSLGLLITLRNEVLF